MPRRNNTSNGVQLTEADISESKPPRDSQDADDDEDLYGTTPLPGEATAHPRNANVNISASTSIRGASVTATQHEHAIYPWDTPLEEVGEPASYHYEPQGELLTESTGAMSSASAEAQPAGGLDEGDTVQSSQQPPVSRAVKRKAGPENVGSTQPSTSKRQARDRTQGSQLPGKEELQHDDTTSNAQLGSQLALPPRKVFPIQVGDKLFRLSGASISSDSPSYFSQFFEEQLRQTEEANHIRTLYIDRDPATFEDIALHLKGYHIEPRDGAHYVRLFADAQFFSLPRLTAQLFASPIYIKIGDTDFQIPRDVFNNPGDSPNYFTLGFSMFFTTPENVFPGLSQRTLLRPPSILPPSVPGRSARTFQDILHLLKGYPLEIRNDAHREELLRDARYYHFKGVEQRLIPHQSSYNMDIVSKEIVIRLEDVRQSGVSIKTAYEDTDGRESFIHYQRPYVDDEARYLIFEIAGDESTKLTFSSSANSHNTAWIHRPPYRRYTDDASPLEAFALAEFSGPTLTRISTLTSVVSNRLNLPVKQPFGLLMSKQNIAGAHEDNRPEEGTGKIRVAITCDTDVTLDGKKWRHQDFGDNLDGDFWYIKRSHWEMRTHALKGNTKKSVEIMLYALKLEAYTNQQPRNASRPFL